LLSWGLEEVASYSARIATTCTEAVSFEPSRRHKENPHSGIFVIYSTHMDYVTILGLVGAGSILVAFIMNQFGKWSKDTLVYDAVNAIGAFILIIYAYLITSYPFMVLNAVWFLVAFKDVVVSIRK